MTDTLWSARFTGPTMIEKDKVQTVDVAIEKDGAAAVISSATFTVYEPNGSKLIDAATATVDGGTVTGSIAAADTTDKALSKNWLIRFDVTIGGVVFSFYNDAVLCLARLYVPIGQTDLIARHSDVANLRSSSTTSLQEYIAQAWTEITNRLYSDGFPFWKMRTPSAFRQVMFSRCFSLIFRDYSTLLDPGDRYAELADRYDEKYSIEYDQIRSKVDVSEDNKLEAHSRPAAPVIMLSGGPRRWWG